MWVHEAECEAAGVDPKAVRRIAKQIERAAKEAQQLGVTVFGGTHSGSLRAADAGRERSATDRLLILADIEGSWDGGDGGEAPDDNGLLRGE